jgi:hypothetical protein
MASGRSDPGVVHLRAEPAHALGQRARVRELLCDWLGLSLSTATINQCVHEAARALEPVVEKEILETVRNVELLHADETA